MKPFIEEKLNEKEVIRKFSSDVDEMELKWHWDREDRTIIPMCDNDWLFQFDNNLPVPINKKIDIPAGTIHRAIKGSTDLVIKVILGDQK